MTAPASDPAWPAVTIHPSQWPERVEASLADALAARAIPPKLHYLTPRQGRRWLAVHQAFAPSAGVLGETAARYRAAFERLSHRLANQPVQVVSLGCGGGGKDASLIASLRTAGCQVRYVAVDAGLSLTLVAGDAVAAAAPGTPVRRLVADLDALGDWRDYVQAGGPPNEIQIFCAFGILPNADPDGLAQSLANWSQPGDAILLTANLFDPGDGARSLPAILPQYDNAETRRWLVTLFEDLDWPVRADDLTFTLEEDGRPARIRARVTVRPEVAALATPTASASEVGRFDVFYTNRFRVEEVTTLLAAHGLAVSQTLETAPGAEGLWVAARAPTDARNPLKD